MGYTKLFSEIVASTIWQEPLHVKVVWITMLAMKDDRHEVRASIPGLAKLSGVSLEQCEEAIRCLVSPDTYSRSKEFEGRRIEEVDGGFLILNGEKFRKIRNEEDRKTYKAEWQKKYRRRRKEDNSLTRVDNSVDKNVDKRSQSGPNRTEQNRTKNIYDHFFDVFWKTYPRKIGKQEAFKEWKKINPDKTTAEAIVEGSTKYAALNEETEPKYILHPCRFLKYRRWEDENLKTGTAHLFSAPSWAKE